MQIMFSPVNQCNDTEPQTLEWTRLRANEGIFLSTVKPAPRFPKGGGKQSRIFFNK